MPTIADLDHRKADLKRRRSALQRRLDRVKGHLKDLNRRIGTARRNRRSLDRTVAFDGTPCFRGQALMLQDCREHGWSGALVSGDRRAGVAEKYGKSSQAALYFGFEHGLPGFLPANPPGHSSHELRDGPGNLPYPGQDGSALQWWQLGLDVSEWDQLVAVAKRLGYNLQQPYHSGSELHHVNLFSNPRKNLIARGIV